jgi:hypothetical protein
MRNQEWESKVIQKLLETHVQEKINVRKETKDFEGDRRNHKRCNERD